MRHATKVAAYAGFIMGGRAGTKLRHGRYSTGAIKHCFELGDFMVRFLRSSDGATVTVVSGRLAIGGVTLLDTGGWAWALFAVRMTDLVSAPIGRSSYGDHFAGLHGRAATEREGLDALVGRWRLWLDEAELCHCVSDGSHVAD